MTRKACAVRPDVRYDKSESKFMDKAIQDMYKEVSAYPRCSGCPGSALPDSTPGVMTWDELLEHMENLFSWGHEEIKA